MKKLLQLSTKYFFFIFSYQLSKSRDQLKQKWKNLVANNKLAQFLSDDLRKTFYRECENKPVGDSSHKSLTEGNNMLTVATHLKLFIVSQHTA